MAVMYSWTLLSRDISGTPFLMGITDDLAEAKRLAEPYLISGKAFLCQIEEVQPAISVHGMDSCHEPTGRSWYGRRNNSDGVTWRERDRPFGAPADLPAWLTSNARK